MENSFYKFMDSNSVEKAPKPLSVNGKDVFTNSEKIHNEQGYYRLVQAEYPKDENLYMPVYELKDNIIYMTWQMTEVSAENKIAQLKEQLTNTDYQAIKYAEGWLTKEEYEPIKAQRQAWRDEINRLETETDEMPQ